MKTHIKKIENEYFEMQLDGSKQFEIRKNDCDYQVGDFILLQEIKELHNTNYQCIRDFSVRTIKFMKDYGACKIHTGRYIVVEITCVIDYEQKEGYVVLGTKELCRYVEE